MREAGAGIVAEARKRAVIHRVMSNDRLAIADAVSDQALLSRLDALASQERATGADLIAHLAALGTRPALYAAAGYGSLFAYCSQALHLSEDAASTRITVAKAAR